MTQSVLTTNPETNLTTLQCSSSSYSIESEDFINPIGKGAFGCVYKALHIQSKTYYAVKQLSKSTKVPLQKIYAEANLMKSILNFKNSCNLLPAIDTAEDNSFYYIVMPICNLGTLSSLIEKNKITSELEALELFRQICYGIKILHENNITHRDIKSDNILLQSYSDPSYPYNYYLSIADYGLSREINPLDRAINGEITKYVGTPYTMAPEVRTGDYDQEADTYSLGCIYYKMLCGYEPFRGNSSEEILKMQGQDTVKISSRFGNLSILSIEILSGCLQYNKTERWNSNKLFKLLKIDSLYTNYDQLKLDPVQYIRLNSLRSDITSKPIFYSINKSPLDAINLSGVINYQRAMLPIFKSIKKFTKNGSMPGFNKYLRKPIKYEVKPLNNRFSMYNSCNTNNGNNLSNNAISSIDFITKTPLKVGYLYHEKEQNRKNLRWVVLTCNEFIVFKETHSSSWDKLISVQNKSYEYPCFEIEHKGSAFSHCYLLCHNDKSIIEEWLTMFKKLSLKQK